MVINSVRSNKYYEKGLVSFRGYNYSRAKKYLKIALFYNYSKSLIYYQMGLIHLYSLDLVEATRSFIDYISLSDDVEEMAYFYTAYSYYLLGNERGAKQWFEKAFSMSSSVLVRYKSLFYLRELGVYSGVYVGRVLDTELLGRQGKRELAISLLLRGEYNSAIELLLEIVEGGVVSSELYRELSDCFLGVGNYNGFISFFYDRFNGVGDIRDKTILFNLAKSFYLASHYEDAKDILVVLLKRFPYNRGLYFNLANAYYKLNRYNLSIKYYQKLVNIDDRFYKAYYNLGVLYHREGLLKQSKLNYEKALSISGGLFKAHYNLGILHYQDNEYLEALESIARSLDIEPGREEALHNFAVIDKVKRIANRGGGNDGQLLSLVNIFLLVLTLVIIVVFFYLR